MCRSECSDTWDVPAERHTGRSTITNRKIPISPLKGFCSIIPLGGGFRKSGRGRFVNFYDEFSGRILEKY